MFQAYQAWLNQAVADRSLQRSRPRQLAAPEPTEKKVADGCVATQRRSDAKRLCERRRGSGTNSQCLHQERPMEPEKQNLKSVDPNKAAFCFPGSRLVSLGGPQHHPSSGPRSGIQGWIRIDVPDTTRKRAR
ncbi:hypothetical protein D4764_13G0007120 [Takifugu flavidus]|uniref:Uncharacterized protein n=1 Tax=Takifugu flavidus TaxID=433684 RepID=A0A5C6PCU0_9TELE|nr:hypothetical protein D4764_13G0007120 [Takifugu flavidus]